MTALTKFFFAAWIAQSLFFLNPKFQFQFKLLVFFCDYMYTDRFVSELVGNPKDQFSSITAQFNSAL